VNVGGTRNIINCCLRSHIKRLVYISSVHAISACDNAATISECADFSKDRVTGGYAVTKAEATKAVLNSVKQGLNAVVIHPSGIIGPYDTGNNHMTQLIKMYISGQLPAGVDGGYDFVDVRDVAKGCLSAARAGKPGNCYILSNRYFTIKELLEYVRIVIGCRKKPCIPIWLAKALAPVFEEYARAKNVRPLYTRYALHTLSENIHFSHYKATAELGYFPRDMQETIHDTVFYLRGHKIPLDYRSQKPKVRQEA
jgi:dihydroflavonol-4-reductase